MLPAMLGFVVLGLSPSFLDYKQTEPGSRERTQFFLYYGVALTLIYIGLRRRT